MFPNRKVKRLVWRTASSLVGRKQSSSAAKGQETNDNTNKYDKSTPLNEVTLKLLCNSMVLIPSTYTNNLKKKKSDGRKGWSREPFDFVTKVRGVRRHLADGERDRRCCNAIRTNGVEGKSGITAWKRRRPSVHQASSKYVARSVS